MTKQPQVRSAEEALRLADWLLDNVQHINHAEAAAELRRLHQSEAEGWRYAEELEQERKRLHEVNQELLEALKDFLNRDEKNTCQHETTHRGGAIWEICDDCGSQWADDRGGKPKWKDPQEWVKARSAIAKAGEKP